MPDYRIIKMTHMSPMHIGLGRDSYDVSAGALHSDTLSAALASLRALRGHDDDLLHFLDSFALSTAFPYSGETYFMPKPIGKLAISVRGMEEREYRKQLKKIAYVSLPIWSMLAMGHTIVVERDQLHGRYLLDRPSSTFVAPMTSHIGQRVSVPREDDQNASPFAFEWTFFNQESGLYCLLDVNGSDIADEVIALFEELGEHGLGSDRNVGGGHFTVDASQTLSLPAVTDANAVMLLSMYIPQEDELATLNVSRSRYQLCRRGGYISGSSVDSLRHLRKNTVYMFTSGSLFNCTHSLCGKVVDLRPQWKDGNLHPVYRSGKAFSINIKTDWS